jgi:hypothetical protein
MTAKAKGAKLVGEPWKLAAIKPYPKNARTHPPAQITLLAAMLKRWGPDQPIVVDEGGIILKGHGRRLAAIEAGMATFPVVVRRGLSREDKVALRLADNQSALLSGWDHNLIRGEMQQLKAAGFDMKLTAFDDASLSWMTSDGEAIANLAGEWNGMPHFENPDAKGYRSIVVHFKDQAAVDKFAKVTKQNINDRTRFLWYPEIEIKPFVKYK